MPFNPARATPDMHPVRAYRARHDLSLLEVAERAGIGFPGLSRIETGASEMPTATVIARLAQACEGEVSEFDIFRWHFARACNYVPPVRAPMTADYAWASIGKKHQAPEQLAPAAA